MFSYVVNQVDGYNSILIKNDAFNGVKLNKDIPDKENILTYSVLRLQYLQHKHLLDHNVRIEELVLIARDIREDPRK